MYAPFRIGTLAAPAPSAIPAAAPADRLSAGQIRFLATGLIASFLVSVSAQFITTNLADIQGAVAATADEASWIATAYTMANFTGIVASGVLVRTFGARRFLVANAAVFALTALCCAWTVSLPQIIALRALQGVAAGGFGPLAFAAVFMTMTGKRLPFGLLLLSFVLLFPVTLGPIVSAYVEAGIGWRSLFAAQVLIGAAIVSAGLAFLPRQPINWPGLRADWVAVLLLSFSLAMLMLVLSQGTRRFWFDSEMIRWATIAGVGAAAGFVFLTVASPLPLIAPRLLLERKFGIPIALNLVFRAGFAVTTYLVPQFLAIVHGFRPLEVAALLAWGAVAQALTLPVVWWLLNRLDGRLVMGFGLLLCGVGTGLLAAVTGLASADQFRFATILFCIGQLLFLAPDLMIGSSMLKPEGLPTASLAFNLTTLGGTTLGVALVSNLVTEREKFHSSVLTEKVSLYDSLDADRIAALASVFAGRLTDEAAATARAVAALSAAGRKQAWVLAFGDGFVLTAIILAVSAIGVVAIGRCLPLSR